MHWKLASLKNSTVFVLSSCNVFVFVFLAWMVNGFFACFPGLGILYSCIKRYKKGCDMIVLRSFGKTWANFKLGSTLQGRTWWGPCSKWLDGSYKFDSCEKVVPGFLVSFWKDNPESVSSFVKVRRWLVFVFITWSFKVELDHLVWYCRIISGNSPKYIGLGIIWNWHVPSCLILSCESFVKLARISCFFCLLAFPKRGNNTHLAGFFAWSSSHWAVRCMTSSRRTGSEGSLLQAHFIEL